MTNIYLLVNSKFLNLIFIQPIFLSHFFIQIFFLSLYEFALLLFPVFKLAKPLYYFCNYYQTPPSTILYYLKCPFTWALKRSPYVHYFKLISLLFHLRVPFFSKVCKIIYFSWWSISILTNLPITWFLSFFPESVRFILLFK